ncbi:MAG TPA: putative maltokinase [Nitrospira sp.]|nr:putative maltokinase [Nitrospira sp.]
MAVNILNGAARTRFEAQLPSILRAQRWFGGKARHITSAQIIDRMVIPLDEMQTVLLLIDVGYRDTGRETYVLAIAAAVGQAARRIVEDMPRAVLAALPAADAHGHEEGILYDAMWHPDVVHRLLRFIGDGSQLSGERGILRASPTTAYASIAGASQQFPPRVLQTQQSNTSVAFGEQALLKLYRRVQAGINPDWEIGRYLTSHAFAHSPAVGGAIEYVSSGETTTVALLQAFVPNQGDAWEAMLKASEGYLARVPQAAHVDSDAGSKCSLWELAKTELSEAGRHLIGPALDSAACLGRRTAALHLTLGQECSDPAFTSEAVTPAYLEARHASMRQLWKQVVWLLQQRSVTGICEQAAADPLAQESSVLAVFQSLLEVNQGGRRIRCHGDFHLGQVLWTGDDYVVTDFEGEPARPIHERRLKHSPLYDVAGMLRSFEYAASSALAHQPKDRRQALGPWMSYWSRWVRAQFLSAYLAAVRHAPFWPGSSRDAARLLTVYELEKAVYELGYELNNRPEWAAIPLKGIREIVHMSGVRAAA